MSPACSGSPHPDPCGSESKQALSLLGGHPVIFLSGQIFFLGFNHGSQLLLGIHGRGGTIASTLRRIFLRPAGLRQQERAETCLCQFTDIEAGRREPWALSNHHHLQRHWEDTVGAGRLPLLCFVCIHTTVLSRDWIFPSEGSAGR